ncbi:MAG: ABC transporter permease [Bacillota bacterium]
MGFGQLIARRMLLLLLVLFGVTVVTFSVSHLVPGDPARMLVGQRASQEVVEQMRHQLGLDRPIWEQYLRYMRNLMQGDLGISIRTQRPVVEDLVIFFPATLELALTAMFLAVAVGIPLGIVSATRKDTVADHVSRVLSVAGVSTPLFWLGLVALLVLYGRLGWLPGSGRLDPFIVPPPRLTGFLLLDSLLAGRPDAFWSTVRHLVLPALCLSYVHLAVVTRQVRASMLEVLSQDYIRTALANGIPGRSVIYRHALRNALIPTVTVVGLAVGDLLGGAILTETIFAWPGMGSYVVDSINFLDFPAIMGFTVFIAVGYVLINLVVDLTYMWLDPRIRAVG